MSRRRAVAQLATLAGAGVGLPVALGHLWPRPEELNEVSNRPDFDPAAERQALAGKSLGWMLIGNSMLNSRLHPPHLAAISGWTTRKIGLGGTQSAIWWLFFKNILIASGARPLWVTVFFRESDLTWPDFRVEGSNAALIQQLKNPQEPEWDQVMAGRTTPPNHAAATVEKICGVDGYGDWARRKVQDWSFALTALNGVKRGARRLELNELFSLDQLRQDLGDDGGGRTARDQPATPGDDAAAALPDPGMYARAPTVFDPSPTASFLPHFLALAAQHDIRLHFHRVKRRPNAAGLRPDLPVFRRYLDDLRHYLLSHGCAYSDESPDPELNLEWYRDGDHIDKPRRQEFAAKFWSLVQDQIGPPPPGGGRQPQTSS